MHILVCDDDTGITEVVKIILEENGYTVTTINSGKAIQKKITDLKPDLILLDLWMPGMDGKEVTKLLKKDPTTKNIPIVLVSAINEIKMIAEKAGADGSLSKPFEISDLVATVQQYA